MSDNPWRCIIQQPDGFSDEMKIYIGLGTPRAVFLPVTLQVVEPYSATEPFMSRRASDMKQFLQVIVDEAWRIGVKPAAYEEPQNELRATRIHLNDMRKIANKYLDIDLDAKP